MLKRPLSSLSEVEFESIAGGISGLKDLDLTRLIFSQESQQTSQ